MIFNELNKKKMINIETAKQFLEINGYLNPDSNFEKELLDTMVEYAQQQVKNNGALGDVSVLFPSKEEIENAAVNCNPEDVNINADHHFEAGVLWLKSYILKSHIKKQITQ